MGNRGTGGREKPRWTQAEYAKAAELLRAGATAALLGRAFGMTRNAALGRVQRSKVLMAIGFDYAKRHPKTRTPKKQSRIAGVLAAPKPKEQHIRVHNIVAKKEGRAFDPGIAEPVKIAPTAFECRAVPLEKLKPRQCRFAVNDAAVGEQHIFCGNPADGSYCEQHAARAYQRERSAHRELRRVA